jgi:hypothetical protein
MLVMLADVGGFAASDVPKLIAPLKYQARFHRQSATPNPATPEYSFEVSWRQLELSGAPLDLLRVINERYQITAFELTTENGR